MRLFILTGASRGIGASLAEQLLSPSHELYCLSRSENDALKKFARTRQLGLNYHRQDLNKIDESVKWLDHILIGLDPAEWEAIHLILNAAVVSPIHRVGDREDLGDIQQSLVVNYLSPIMLSERFVHRTQDWQVQKRITFIGSRAASKTMPAFSHYCSSKAGLERFVDILAAEQRTVHFPVESQLIHPGTVDTSMQTEIRAQDVGISSLMPYFQDLKKNGKLLSPQIVACEILKLLNKDVEKESLRVDIEKQLKAL
ncbi:MAG: SDR family NAD(P)-dependent oxidoreductase [Bacteroidota bacterium]